MLIYRDVDIKLFSNTHIYLSSYGGKKFCIQLVGKLVLMKYCKVLMIHL